MSPARTEQRTPTDDNPTRSRNQAIKAGTSNDAKMKSREVPNAKTQAVMTALDKGQGKRFSAAKDMYKDLGI